MNRFLFLVICVVLCSVTGFAQSRSYEEMLGKLKGGDVTIDFKTLRFAFAEKTPAESRVADPKIQGQMLALLNEKKFKDVIKISEGIHNSNFVDMNSHIVAAMAYQGLGDAKRAKFHEAVYVGLVNSIMKDADGTAPKTAYHVISIAEEYVLLNALELKRGTHTIESNDGHNYHVLSATDKTTNEVVKLYFNIDKVQTSINAVPKSESARSFVVVR